MAPMFAGGMFKGLGKPPSNLDFQMNSLESMNQNIGEPASTKAPEARAPGVDSFDMGQKSRSNNV